MHFNQLISSIKSLYNKGYFSECPNQLPYPKREHLRPLAEWVLDSWGISYNRDRLLGSIKSIVEDCVKNKGKISQSLQEDLAKEIPSKKKKKQNTQTPKPAKKKHMSPYRMKAKEFYKSRAWKEMRYKALKYYGGRCCVCGRSAKDGVVLQVDHIIPLSKDWEKRLVLSNLQVMCEDCNIGKSNTDTINWREDLPEPMLPFPNS